MTDSKQITALFGDIAKILGELEKTIRESPESENPEVQAAKEKLLKTILGEMTSTADYAASSSIALPFFEKLQESLPLPVPFGLAVTEEDDEKEPI